MSESGQVAGAREVECLTSSNFKEIKNLIKYITTEVVPMIGRLESAVEELTEEVQRLKNKEGIGRKRPAFCMTFDDEDSDSE